MGTAQPVRNPWTGELDYEFAEPTQYELDAECERLQAAQHRWSTQSLAFRIEQLKRFRQSLETHRAPIVRCLEEDTGRIEIAALEFRLRGLSKLIVEFARPRISDPVIGSHWL